MSELIKKKRNKGTEKINRDLVIALTYSDYETIISILDNVDALVGAIAWLDYDMSDDIPVIVNELADLAYNKLGEVYEILNEAKEKAINSFKNPKENRDAQEPQI